MKKIFPLLCLLFIATFLFSCKKTKISSIEVVGNQSEYGADFSLSDLTVKVHMSDGTVQSVPLTESMIKSQDLSLLQKEGTHTIEVTYQEVKTTFTITIKGEKGDDGREVVFQIKDGYIQWKYDSDTTWTNLIALSALTGPAGINGENGKNVEFQVKDNYIQWKYQGDESWTNLISLSLLMGPKGNNGVDGREVVFQIKDGYIQWKYNTDTTWTNLVALSSLTGPAGVQGEDGREVVFQVKDNYIQWQYQGESGWNNLIALETLMGPIGKQGPAGKEVTFKVDGDYIKWQYQGESNWNNLIAIEDLRGQAPVIEISEDGYWVIDGVKTDKVAVLPKKIFTLTFDVNNGVMPDNTALTMTVIEGKTVVLPQPTRLGYIFKGWHIDINRNDTEITSTTLVSEDLNLVAKWEIDYHLVENFFNHLYDNNITYRLVHIGDYFDGIDWETDYEQMILKLNRVNDKVYLKTELTSQYLVNNQIADSYNYEVYNYYAYPYHFGFFNERLGNYQFQYEYDEYFEFDINDILHGLGEISFLDFHRFIKHEDSLIYDYQFNSLDYERLDFSSDAQNIQLSLDLSLNQLIISFEYQDDEKIKKYTLIIGYQDLGSTKTEYPLTEIKEAALFYIDSVYDEYSLNIAMLVGNAKDYFFNYYNMLITTIKNTQDIGVICSSVLECERLIEDYYYSYNEIEADRYRARKDIKEIYKDFIELATAESINKITTFYNEFMDLINVLEDKSDLRNCVMQFEYLCVTLYEEDTAKSELLEYISYKYNDLSILMMYLDNLCDYSILEEIQFELYILLKEASTHEEVDEIVNSCINYLREYDFIMTYFDKENIRKEVLNYLTNMYNDYHIDEIYISSLPLYNELQKYKKLVYETDFVGNMVYYMIEANQKFKDISITLGKEVLEMYYSMYKDLVSDQTSLYNAYNNHLNNIKYSNAKGVVYSFEAYCNSAPKDQLKFNKFNLSDNMKAIFDDYKLTALDECIPTMQEIFDNSTEKIKNAATIIDVNNIYNKFYEDLMMAYKPDTDKITFIYHQEDTVGIIYNILEPLIDCIDYDYKIEIIEIKKYIYDMVNEIKQAKSIDEINHKFTILYQGLITNDWHLYDEFEKDLSDYLLSELEYVYYLCDNIDEVKDLYDNACIAIKNETSIYNMFDIYLSVREEMFNIYTEYYRTMIASDMEELYLFLMEVGYEEDLESIQDMYQSTLSMVLKAKIVSEIDRFAYTFFDFCDDLEIDIIKDTKHQFLLNLQSYIDELSKLASNDSILEMELIYAEYSAIITNCDNYDDVCNKFEEAVDLINEAYEIDDDKFDFYLKKQETIYTINNFVSFMKNVSVRYFEEIDVITVKYINDIEKATSLTMVEELYDEWYNEMQEQTILFDYTKLISTQDDLYSYLHKIFDDCFGDLPEIPEYLITTLETTIDNMYSTYNYFELYRYFSSAVSYFYSETGLKR